MISTTEMIPYIGYGDLKLYSDLYTILNQFEGKKNSIVYLGYKNEIIRIDITDSLMLFFSKENNKGCLIETTFCVVRPTRLELV